MAETAGSPGEAARPPRPEQARSVERKAQLLAATIGLLISGGVNAVTHRGVAEEADSSPGAVRYHFGTREDLLAACLEEIERVRFSEAERIIDDVDRGGPFQEEYLAWMILRACYGPHVDDAGVTGMLWSIIDCGRESPRLAQVLGQYRHSANRQLGKILSACGYMSLQPSLVAAVLDGGILTATVEGISPVTESAVTDLAAILRMAEGRGN